ncbi:MAG: molybdopterin-binding/glycosyltransferase family 2 protein [Rhodocyclales bacterium]|nr:molybdopterin-binding/glycosyltransferase family 2 protein [Rhodocyclales bacterium]
MIFGKFPLAECEGLLLAHSLRLPDRIMKKGRRLTAADLQALGAAGIMQVNGARLDADDFDENAAAGAVAVALGGPGIAARAPHAGRCNIFAAERGLVAVDADIINRINRLDESVTVATLPPLSAVRGGAVVATVKIIPLAVSRALVEACLGEAGQAGQGAALRLLPFQPQRAALIVTEQPNDPQRNYTAAVTSSRRRLEDLGSHLGLVQRCAHRRAAVTAALQEALAAGCSLILISGTTVPKDRADTVPAGIVAAGGEIIHFGMPVEPGNMLLLACIGAVPVIILPGCARSRRSNGLDWVLQRMLAGLPMATGEIMAMGVGGLIRSPLEAGDDENASEPEPVRAPVGRRVAALVLAAGSGRRMGGGNKLLQPVGGVPMLRRVANAALASRCTSVVVVTGFAAEEVQSCLAGLEVHFAHNAEHLTGMASSLRCGLAALAPDVDAVVVLLGDMPCIHGGHIDRLIAAFDPQRPKIVVPMKDGRRGNPIIWPRSFFAEMQTVEGDVGARDLLRRHADQIEAVAFDDDAIFADVDTSAALAGLAGQ